MQLLTPEGVPRTAAAQIGFGDGENIGDAAHRRPSSSAAAARSTRSNGCFLIDHDAARADPAGPRTGLLSRSATAAGRSRGRTTGCSFRCTIAGAAGSATSGRTIPSTGCCPTPNGCRSSAPSRTRRRPRSSRRRSSSEIQNAAQYHRALIDASPIAIVDFDLEGRVRSWNDGATQIFGWTADETIGRVSPIVPEDELDFFLGNMARIAHGETMTRPRPAPGAPRRLADRRQHVGGPDPRLPTATSSG